MEKIRDNWAEWLIAVAVVVFMVILAVVLMDSKKECEADGGTWRAKPAGCVESTR